MIFHPPQFCVYYLWLTFMSFLMIPLSLARPCCVTNAVLGAKLMVPLSALLGLDWTVQTFFISNLTPSFLYLYDLLYPRFGVKRIFSRDQKLVWWWRTTSPPLICSACSSSGASWRGWRLWPSSPSCTMGPSASLPFFVAPSLSIGSSSNRPQLCNVLPGQILSRLLGN